MRSPALALLLVLAVPTGAALLPTPALADDPTPVSEKMGARVSRGAIAEALEVLDEPANRARLGRILNSAPMRAAMHDLTESIVLGVFDGVRQAMASPAAGGAGKGKAHKGGVAGAIGAGIDESVAPAVGRLSHRIVDSVLTASLADEHLVRIEKLAQGTSHAAVRGLAAAIEHDLGPALAATLEHDLGPALAATLERDLGPALAVVIERDILPAIGRGLDGVEMQSAVANLTRSVATEVVGGANEAILVATQESRASGEESSLQIFGTRVAVGYAIALFLAFALATMLVVTTVLLVRSSRRRRREREAAAAAREAEPPATIDESDDDPPPTPPEGHHDARGSGVSEALDRAPSPARSRARD